MDEIENTGVARRTSAFGGNDRPADVVNVVIGNSCWADVGAVDRKICHHLHQRIPQAVQSEVAGMPFGQCNPRKLVGQHVQFADERDPYDQFAAMIGEVVKIGFLVTKISI